MQEFRQDRHEDQEARQLTSGIGEEGGMGKEGTKNWQVREGIGNRE